ncbi:sigma-54 interaction domain-containing protein [Myxococcus xanthus]|uniref:Sigma 54-interacting transcriptional regulator n=1 Tax=Myxococcus xanthus TaxID=34 RepID=A0A7Y4MUK4_MYXXA|nr:sigma 54-interacting transcriptional regulator [Myxococcus xanthus]NOJ82814.1 sigma 54-interacting transcriptional regulator [Myxococcus xanthus]NOJ90114.1 sigma 54-interacting transcriptional regulator [Myxococcus xanthus]
MPTSHLALPALDALAGPVLLVDDARRVTALTPSLEALLGGALRAGTPLAQVLVRADGTAPLDAVLENGREASVRLRVGGRSKPVRVRAVPLARGPRTSGWALLVSPDAVDETSGRAELFHGLWTQAPELQRVFRIVEKVARTESSVLVRGESGTGKEHIAHALHALSARARGPFRAINCAALPPNLLESELFGHVRGAFTGAVRDSPGHFRLADKGSLFLDEVAEMPLDLQAKMLRVLETRTVIPVGGRQPVPVDVRIIAATHRPLRREVEAGRFRADLMYRLRVVPLFLPTLRERRGDILPLALRFLEELHQRGARRVERFSPGARRLLEEHPWPGNVRELRNVMEYAYVIGEGPVLREADLPPEFSEPRQAAAVSQPPPDASLEPERIRAALAQAGGNRSEAARLLGVSRVTLWRRLRDLGVAAER